MPSKKTPPKKQATKKTPKKKSDGSPLLAHFPHPPPALPADARHLPNRGEPGSWGDEFDRLPNGPEVPSLVGTHWVDAKKLFWRFEPAGKMSYGSLSSGGVSPMQWTQRGPWVFVVSAHPGAGAEILARVEGDTIAGYRRAMTGLWPLEYHRVEGEPIDEYIRLDQDLMAWMVGPRDRPQPPRPVWRPGSSRAAAPAAAGPALRFANHRPARPLAAMTPAERKHLAAHAGTIDEQAEFGHVEAIDLLDGKKVAYHLYWWPFTDGVLVSAATGAVVADLLDGSMAIDDASLRSRVEAGYREGRDALPKSLTIAFR